MKLVLNTNNSTNPQSLDLTNYVMAAIGEGMDPASPAFSNRQFTTSLLKEGGTFTLENPKLKELMFPLLLGPTPGSGAGSSSATALLISTINQVLQTPGATAQWQDDGMSQATYFNLASGQVDVQYDYRKGQQHYTMVKLRLFAQPFGTTAAPRVYASASAVGPLLMISPYASSGVYAVAASTQGVAGFGGQQQGPSSGIFYSGNPSLAGDAPALLQVDYSAPFVSGATWTGVAPYVAVSWLPDQNYRPLITASQCSLTVNSVLSIYHNVQTAVASTYANFATGFDVMTFNPYANGASVVPAAWVGQHRLFAIARLPSSAGTQTNIAFMQSVVGPAIPFSTSATVSRADWSLYDLGTFALRASEAAPTLSVFVSNSAPSATEFDVTAFVMLPDNATWFLNPTAIQASQYGFPIPVAAAGGFPGVARNGWSNTFFIDDTLPDQFMYGGTSRLPPALAIASASRITQYSRGIIPRPDPARGAPILAILGVGQAFSGGASFADLYGAPHATATTSWANPQNVPAYAQVSVVERARYVLP